MNDRVRKNVPHVLSQQAAHSYFGIQKELPTNPTGTVPTSTNLANLGGNNHPSTHPTLMAVSIDLDVDVGTMGAGELDVFAELSWETGSGSNTAEIDVPARGVVAYLVAADGLNVDVLRNTGPAANQDTVRGRVNIGYAGGGAGSQGVQRTIVTGVLPIPARLQIPKFAVSVTLLPDILGALAAPAGTLLFSTEIAAGVIAGVAAPVGGEFVRVPNAALFFFVTGIAGATVRAIFQLALS